MSRGEDRFIRFARLSSTMSVNFEDLVNDTNYSLPGGGTDRERAVMQELERKKKARSLAVPTDDNKVKARLREIGEPITLFGERVRYVFAQTLNQTLSALTRLLTVETVSSTSFLK